MGIHVRYAHVDMEPSLQDSEQLQAEFRGVCRERDDLAARVCSLERALSVLTNELNGSRRNLDPDRPAAAAVDDQTCTAADVRRLVAELESRLSDAETDNRRLCEVIVQLKTERAELRMQLDEFSDKLAECQQTVTRLEDDRRELNERLQGISRLSLVTE